MTQETNAVCLTFDLDGMALWGGSFGSRNPSMISRGEFETIATDRILGSLERRDIRATFFVPGHTAWAWPDLVKRIADAGHEIGHHGWVHENPAALDPAAERAVLERGFEAIEHAVGQRPTSYRSPAWDFSPQTVDLLLEYGIRQDSSCMAGDFHPYYLRRGDRFSATEPYVFGEVVPLVEVPPSWGLDDFPPLEFVWGTNPGIATPRAVEELWREEFDFMVSHFDDGVFTLTCHPQIIGRGSRLEMLARLLNHFMAAGVRFARLDEVGDRFARQYEPEAWARAHPERSGAAARNAPPVST